MVSREKIRKLMFEELSVGIEASPVVKRNIWLF
jgi:hypothetical protein